MSIKNSIVKRLIIDGEFGSHHKKFHQEYDRKYQSILFWRRYCSKYLNIGYSITVETYRMSLIKSERVRL